MQTKLEAKNKVWMDTNYIKKQKATKKGPHNGGPKEPQAVLEIKA